MSALEFWSAEVNSAKDSPFEVCVDEPRTEIKALIQNLTRL